MVWHQLLQAPLVLALWPRPPLSAASHTRLTGGRLGGTCSAPAADLASRLRAPGPEPCRLPWTAPTPRWQLSVASLSYPTQTDFGAHFVQLRTGTCDTGLDFSPHYG
ncbi:hypothetical protein V8C86DRAFT_2790304 [Haematococcus lacustris]